MQAERRDERRGEELLLRAAVALAREERGQRAVQDPARQQADDRLVGVERALRQEERPDAQADAGCRAGGGDRERASRLLIGAATRATPMPAAHSTKSSGRLA